MDIKGNLVFLTGGDSEVRNFIVERIAFASLPATPVSEKGRIVFDTTNDVYRYNDGTEWVQFATGGNAAALQTELDNTQASLGSFINADGTFDAASLNALGNVTGLTGGDDLLAALTQLDAAVTAAAGVDTLGELTDVTLAAPSAGQVLRFTGTGNNSVNATLVLDDLGDVVGTGSSGDVLYHDGSTFVMGAPGATSGVQAHDAALDALSNVAGTGFIVQDGADSFITTALVAGGTGLEGINIADTSGIGDAPTIGLDIGSLTAEVGTVQGTDRFVMFDGLNNVKVTLSQMKTGLLNDGIALADLSDVDSVNGSTTADAINVLVGDGSGFDAQVLTAGNDITADTAGSTVVLNVDDSFLRNDGDTLDSGTLTIASGAAINAATGSTISMVDAPTSDTHVTNKAYVDALTAGLKWKNSVRAATQTNVADLAAGAPDTVDGISLTANERVLVLNQTNAAENGIYVVDTLGTGSDGAWSRADDMDALTPIDEVNAAAVWVEEGTVTGDTGWTVTSQVATLGTDDIIFTQFNGAAGIGAGTGLSKAGNTLNINMGAGVVELPGDEVGLDLYGTNNPLLLTLDGSTASTATGAQLHVRYDGSTIDTNGSTELYIPAQGITETEIATTVAGDGISGGNGTALAVNVDDSTIEIDTDTLRVKDAGITNVKLANDDITFDGDAGTAFARDLGTTVTFAGGTNIDTSVATGTVTINWSAAMDDLSDVAITSLATNDILQYNGTNFVNVTPAAVGGDIAIGDLSDVNNAGVTFSEILMYDESAAAYTPRPIYFLYSNASLLSTTHVVPHNLGRKYCNVTVVDASDEVIIPQSITFDNDNQLTVTFNSAIGCRIVVMGVPELQAD